MKVVQLYVFFSVGCFILCSDILGVTMFHIGNSHTWDLKPNYGLRKIFEAGGETLDNDWQIVCGKSLDYIVNNPTSSCVPPAGYSDYVEALTDQAWDVVTIQPFPGASGRAEIDALSDIIGLASWRSSPGQTRYFVYCTWPIVPDEDLVEYAYDDVWDSPYVSGSNSTLANREFFIFALKTIRDQHPDLPIEVIPVGAVLAVFHELAEAGQISGFSGAGELYRDRYHMNNVGRYIAALTTYAVVTERAASDLGADSIVGFGVKQGSLVDRTITHDLRMKIVELVDRVIAQKPFEDLPLTLNYEVKGVSFKTHTGYRYTLQHSKDLSTWSDVIYSAAGDSSTMQHFSAISDVTGFWRLSRD
jgi:hypothetical protein